MDRPSDHYYPHQPFNQSENISSRRKMPKVPKQSSVPSQPMLFHDTSLQPGMPQSQAHHMYSHTYTQDYSRFVGYGEPDANFALPGFMHDQVTDMAVQYGANLADRGKDYVNKNVEKFVFTSKIKYYFAVDTAYVGKKLGLLTFPFTHTDWSIKYNREEPIAPRYEVNAPDLYIPVMAFVTYILVAGISLGIQNKFSPEQLGIQASSAFGWLIIEVLATLISLYFLNVTTDLKYLDLIAYSSYKYIGMIICLASSFLFRNVGYYVALTWFSITIVFFLIRTLKVQILSHAGTAEQSTHGRRRNFYLILSLSLIQPVFMWFTTRKLALLS